MIRDLLKSTPIRGLSRTELRRKLQKIAEEERKMGLDPTQTIKDTIEASKLERRYSEPQLYRLPSVPSEDLDARVRKLKGTQEEPIRLPSVPRELRGESIPRQDSREVQQRIETLRRQQLQQTQQQPQTEEDTTRRTLDL